MTTLLFYFVWKKILKEDEYYSGFSIPCMLLDSILFIGLVLKIVI